MIVYIYLQWEQKYKTVSIVCFLNNFKTVNLAVFWVVASCSLVEFTDVSEVLVASMSDDTDDGGSKDL
jgi:hypothetical protein